MPVKKSVFLIRSLSAIVFIFLFLGLFWWNSWSFFFLFSIIHWGCWYEYQKLMQRTFPIYQSSQLYYLGIIFLGWGILMIGGSRVLHIGSVTLEFIGFTLVLCTVFLLPILGILFHSKGVGLRSKMSLLGFFYITLPLFLAIYLRTSLFAEGRYGLFLLMLVVLAVWLNDTFAYLIGSWIGKHKFFPKISPKKTWEGSIGGIIVGTLCVGWLSHWVYMQFPQENINTLYEWQDINWNMKFANPYFLFTLALCACVFGTIGDLLESLLKRRAGVKDAGQIMPGHGGFLDRFDSFLLALPATLLAIILWI